MQFQLANLQSTFSQSSHTNTHHDSHRIFFAFHIYLVFTQLSNNSSLSDNANESRSHLNERDHENMKIILFKRIENLPLLTRCIFLFSDSIIRTSKLSVFSFEAILCLVVFLKKKILRCL